MGVKYPHRFRPPMMQALYEACRNLGRDFGSELYHRPDSGHGPVWPRGGAAHRDAYWQGRKGGHGLYGRDPRILAYAAWAAGDDDRKQDEKRKA